MLKGKPNSTNNVINMLYITTKQQIQNETTIWFHPDLKKIWMKP
jgi:hypothetical protein